MSWDSKKIVDTVVGIAPPLITLIAALATMFVTINNGQVAYKDSLNRDVKLEVIHELVNSRLSKALQDIKDLRGYIAKITNTPLEPDVVEEMPPPPSVLIEKATEAVRKAQKTPKPF